MPLLISITEFTEGNMGKHRKNIVAKLCRHLVSCPLRTRVKFCTKVDCTSMMKSREYDDTKKKSGCLLRNNETNKVAKLCLHLLSRPLRPEWNSARKMITHQWWSQENTMRRKKQWCIKEKQKLHQFRSKELCLPFSVRICVWVWQENGLS